MFQHGRSAPDLPTSRPPDLRKSGREVGRSGALLNSQNFKIDPATLGEKIFVHLNWQQKPTRLMELDRVFDFMSDEHGQPGFCEVLGRGPPRKGGKERSHDMVFGDVDCNLIVDFDMSEFKDGTSISSNPEVRHEQMERVKDSMLQLTIVC